MAVTVDRNWAWLDDVITISGHTAGTYLYIELWDGKHFPSAISGYGMTTSTTINGVEYYQVRTSGTVFKYRYQAFNQGTTPMVVRMYAGHPSTTEPFASLMVAPPRIGYTYTLRYKETVLETFLAEPELFSRVTGTRVLSTEIDSRIAAGTLTADYATKAFQLYELIRLSEDNPDLVMEIVDTELPPEGTPTN